MNENEINNDSTNTNTGSDFKAVTNNKKKNNSKNTVYVERNRSGFGRSFVVPLISGMLGCVITLGVVFGIPEIRGKVFATSQNISSPTNSSTSSNGTVSYVDLNNYSNTSVYAANKILPSIVGIKVEYTVSSNNYFSMFGGSMHPQTSSASASGSGIIISDDGYILTNNHIVATSSSESYYQVSDANKVTVTLYNDETEYEAKIIGKDEQTDLAVIKIDKTGLAKADFADSDSLKVGEFAMAVGNPLGLQSTITCGVISAVNREVTDTDGKKFKLIQTDAAINSGNSGGALVNSKGEVIGINTLKLSGTGIEGMGFAIPINSTTDIVSQLIQYNKVKRPYIGITGIDLNERTAKTYNLAVGIYVRAVENFTAAERAGLKSGDVIVEADGKSINTMEQLNEIKNSKQIGDEIKLKINRNGSEQEVTLVLGEQP